MHVHWSPRVANLRELDVDVNVLLEILGSHGLAHESLNPCTNTKNTNMHKNAQRKQRIVNKED